MKEDFINTKISTFAKIENGYAFKSKEYVDDGLRIIRIANVQSGEIIDRNPKFYPLKRLNEFKNYTIHEDDFLISLTGNVGRVGRISKELLPALLNQRVGKFNFLNSEILKDYFYYFLNSSIFLHQVIESSKGVAQLNSSSRKIEEITIPITSLVEQKAIVAKIEELFSSLDSGISDLKKAQEQLVIYRQSVLKKAFEGELTKEWREEQTNLPTADELLMEIKEQRQKHYEQEVEDWEKAIKYWEENNIDGKKPGRPRKSKDIDASKFDFDNNLHQWKWCKLGSIANKISDGPFGSHLKTADYVDSGVRVIRLENIGNLMFDDSKKSFVTESKYESIKNHTIYPNDIIFASFISEKISVVALPSHIEFAINKADCFCIRFNHLVNFKFYEYFLSTRNTYNQLVNKVHGATRPRINTTQIKEVFVPLCSIQEQHQIVREIESRLSFCDKVEESIVESLEKAKALRQSILKKAFEGKLLSEAEIAKCKLEKDYEPASVLLEKIKTEKKKK